MVEWQAPAARADVGRDAVARPCAHVGATVQQASMPSVVSQTVGASAQPSTPILLGLIGKTRGFWAARRGVRASPTRSALGY